MGVSRGGDSSIGVLRKANFMTSAIYEFSAYTISPLAALAADDRGKIPPFLLQTASPHILSTKSSINYKIVSWPVAGLPSRNDTHRPLILYFTQ